MQKKRSQIYPLLKLFTDTLLLFPSKRRRRKKKNKALAISKTSVILDPIEKLDKTGMYMEDKIMNWITPQIVFWISLGLITIGLSYKWFEHSLLRKMHRSPESFSNISKGYRLRYQEVYGVKFDNKHLRFEGKVRYK